MLLIFHKNIIFIFRQMVSYSANIFRYESFPSRDIIETWAVHNESAGTDDEYEVAECMEVLLLHGNCDSWPCRADKSGEKKRFDRHACQVASAYDTIIPREYRGLQSFVFCRVQLAAANLFLIKRS